MDEIIKHYTNDEITIVWKPASCIHSRNCWHKVRGLPEVFDPAVRPWIKPLGASTERIIEQINQCPSGALSFIYNNPPAQEPEVTSEIKVEVLPNGPLLVYGNISVKCANGEEVKKSNITAFCRCGLSANKPYCDGSHITGKFEG